MGVGLGFRFGFCVQPGMEKIKIRIEVRIEVRIGVKVGVKVGVRERR